MGAIDRNAKDSHRLLRNQQRGKVGGFSASVKVVAPLTNTSAGIQLNLLPAGGLTNSSLQLTVKLATNPGLSLSASGLTAAIDGTGSGLSLTASGIKYTDPATTKGDVSTFSTVPTRLAVGANNTVLTADSTQTTGLKWATPTVYLLASNFVFNETPAGTQNSANTAFTFANTPTAATVQAFKNGLLLKPTTDYSVATNTITYVVAPAPADVLLAHYMK